MAKRLKPVTEEELSRAMLRIEDINATANELVRRFNANADCTALLPIERTSLVLAASAALNDLATHLLRAPWWAEQKRGAPVIEAGGASGALTVGGSQKAAPGRSDSVTPKEAARPIA